MSKTIEVSDETYEKIKDHLGLGDFKELDSLDDLIGEKYYFRTVTFHIVGKVKKRMGNFFVMEKASWVPDSGRLMNAIKDGELNEVEPVGNALINLDSVVDAFPWTHKLPTEQK